MFDFDDPKNWVAVIIGLLLLALGLIPLLNNFGVIGFGLPGFLNGIVSKIGLWIVAAGGLFLLIDSFLEDHSMRMISIVVALLILAVGIIPLLNSFGIIGFTIPFLSVNVYNIIFVIEGLFLLIAAFAMM